MHIILTKTPVRLDCPSSHPCIMSSARGPWRGTAITLICNVYLSKDGSCWHCPCGRPPPTMSSLHRLQCPFMLGPCVMHLPIQWQKTSPWCSSLALGV